MPSLGVDVVVIENGQVLLTKREDFRVWCLPGGAVDPGESVSQAALREVHEETGLTVELTRLVGIYSRPLWRGGGDHVVVFAAKPLTRILQLSPTEVLEATYFDPQKLPEQFLWWQRYYVSDALNGIGGSVARSIQAVWPFDQNLTRQELYTLRDQGGIPSQLISTLWEEPRTESQILEVGEGKSEMKLRIVVAKLEDAPLVHRLMREAFSEYEGVLAQPSGANRETVEDVIEAMNQGGAILAWEDSEAVGSARYRLEPDFLYVGRVSVLPAHRGKGIAKALMLYMEDVARQQGRNELQVAVRMSLPSNVQLYQGLGYEIFNTAPHPKGPDVVANLVKRI